MKKAIIYIHGKGGNAEEAERFKAICEKYDVIGFDYKSQTPWEAKEEFPDFFDEIYKKYKSVIIFANSIGAFFTISSLYDKPIEKAFFISPIVDMLKLISDMMMWAGVDENELCRKRVIETDFGETLSWDYLCYVKENPIKWTIPTYILYGEKDNLTAYDTISDFAERISAKLTVMKNGEHWFHTEEQMLFLDNWIADSIRE